MEQYWMPKELDFLNLKKCIDNYKSKKLFIRDCGGMRDDGIFHCSGLTKVNKNLYGNELNFRKTDSGLHILLDSEEVFHFPLEDYQKGFSLAYERIEEGGRRIIWGDGKDPYDPYLPKPNKSILRTVLDDHLMEIDFEGRIDLKFHSWWDESDWKYWTID
jgi:hypothetical protein